MKKYIMTILKNMLLKESKESKELVKPMGRWRIENCNIQTNNKIDLSNEDHCGPCGQYALSKMGQKEPQKKG